MLRRSGSLNPTQLLRIDGLSIPQFRIENRTPFQSVLMNLAQIVLSCFLIACSGAATASETLREPAALAEAIRSGAHPGIDGLIISRGAVTLADAAAPTLPAAGRDIRSATKSITALLVGIAIDRGSIASVDTPIVDLLPEYADALLTDPRKARIRVRDLLTMRSGLDCDDWDRASPGHEDRMYRKRDWLAFWAAVPMRDEPGTRFSYCTGNVVALGRIVEIASGQTLSAFAEDALFEPLGIRGAQWATWKGGSRIDSGGHLRISPEGLRRIGQLLLDGGEAGGRRIVSEAWRDAMTSEHVQVPGQSQRYGYLWWLDATTSPSQPQTRLWMAWGNGGNFLIVVPELDAVVVFSGTRYNRPDALEPLLWFRDRLLPALRDAP
jgi:CubicO group peptidase (beta-lactamase class C family)